MESLLSSAAKYAPAGYCGDIDRGGVSFTQGVFSGSDTDSDNEESEKRPRGEFAYKYLPVLLGNMLYILFVLIRVDWFTKPGKHLLPQCRITVPEQLSPINAVFPLLFCVYCER